MATSALRATALPLPEVKEGELVSIGYGRLNTRLRAIVIGESDFFRGSEGVYTSCWKCLGSGFLSNYAGIYDGVCFPCNGRGVRLYAATVEAAQRKVRSAQAAQLRAAAKAEAERPAREAAEKAALQGQIERAHALALEEHAEWIAKQERIAAQRFAGEVGSKVTVTGKVVKNLSIENNFGYRESYSRLVIVEGTGDDAGITLKTFGTSEWHYDVEEGDEVKVTATVKDHSTAYQNTKQTVVIRPKTAK